MSVTAVPLQPIRKGSVRRLWLGLAVVVAGSALLTWNGLRPFGLREAVSKDGISGRIAYQILAPGVGAKPAKDDFALVSYKGSLPDGTLFEETPQPTPMDLSSMIPGFTQAVTMIAKGGKIRVRIPAELAYGDNPPQGSPIPAGSPLIFDITLVEHMARAQMMELQRRQQLQQMLQQQMQGGGGVPGGAPPGGPPVDLPDGAGPAPQGAPGQP